MVVCSNKKLCGASWRAPEMGGKFVASDAPLDRSDDGVRGVLKSPQDFAGGLFLLLFAAIALYGAWPLKFGQLRGIGPGLMPKVAAMLLAAFGVFLLIQSFFSRGSVLDRWSIRGPFFVLGAVLLFAFTIRGVDLGKDVNLPYFGNKLPALGLLVSGPLAVIFSSFADKSTKWAEVLIFAVVITAFCIGLFKYALRLPIPLAPWWLGY
jgi:putative tricarboxylic transport membrane protein